MDKGSQEKNQNQNQNTNQRQNRPQQPRSNTNQTQNRPYSQSQSQSQSQEKNQQQQQYRNPSQNQSGQQNRPPRNPSHQPRNNVDQNNTQNNQSQARNSNQNNSNYRPNNYRPKNPNNNNNQQFSKGNQSNSNAPQDSLNQSQSTQPSQSPNETSSQGAQNSIKKVNSTDKSPWKKNLDDISIPLEKRIKELKDPLGNVTEVPTISSTWVKTKFNLLPYLPINAFHSLPSVNRQEYLTFINRDLSLLLKFEFSEFWCQVLFDPSIPQFLDSYLRFKLRNFEAISIPTQGNEGSEQSDDCYDLEFELFKRVLIIFLRLSNISESNKGHWGKEAYEESIKGKFFDIPKLMDICALFGGDNKSIVKDIINNCFTNLSYLQQDLSSTCQQIIELLKKLESQLKLKFSSKESMKVGEVLDVHHYLSDIFQTIKSFGEIYQPSLLTIGKLDPLPLFTTFYRFILPNIEKFWNLDPISQQTQNDKFHQRHLKLRRNILSISMSVFENCFGSPLSNLLNSQKKNNTKGKNQNNQNNSQVSKLLEQMFATLMEALESETEVHEPSFPSFFMDLEKIHKFNQRLLSIHGLLIETQPEEDPRMEFILGSISTIINPSSAFIKQKQTSSLSPSTSTSISKNQEPEMSVERLSLISQVEDLFPDFGKGFIDICLEQFNDNVEKLIHHLLEDSLPEQLKSLDHSMKSRPPKQIQNQDQNFKGKGKEKEKPEIDAKGKGKGKGKEKYIEKEYEDENVKETSNQTNNKITSEMENKANVKEDLLSQRKNIYDGDEFDIFNNQRPDPSKIQIGKKEDKSNFKHILNDKSLIQDLKETYLYEYDEENEVKCDINNKYEYDDEYDDTYDEVESAFADPSVVLDEQIQDSSQNELVYDLPILITLAKMRQTSPSTFERTASARQSNERDTLRKETGLSDEQIEGWFIMVKREPKKYLPPVDDEKEDGFYDWDGKQNELEEEDSDQENQPHGHPQRPGRPTQSNASKTNKQKNKSRIGNHNRKNAYSKKMKNSIVL